jgi:uncharacterized protein YebE (UPF0316 family)
VDYKKYNMEILQMIGLTILQNASFTLISRARNSNSICYHAIASVLSNGIWLLVIRNVVSNLDKPELMISYLVGSVIGSISMHYIAMKYFEKKQSNGTQKLSEKNSKRRAWHY